MPVLNMEEMQMLTEWRQISAYYVQNGQPVKDLIISTPFFLVTLLSNYP
jgi:hypothetical protein